MIYDRVKNIEQYKGISKNLDRAIAFLSTIDSQELSDGKNEIDGKNVFANVMYYDTKDIEDGVKEAHKVYIDIHYMISGKEQILISDISELEIVGEYLEEKDCAFYAGQMKTACILQDDYFVICFPNDGHTPAIKIDNNEQVKKMVIKVRV
ncbi:MAG TPA: DUF386 domain-containing protein [Epulopiscium sp.]|nr:DUF386 domain-containing protein [Candidatus Epulonipiscium sp.]